MGNFWNRDIRAALIAFLTPVTGPITTEYLTNDSGCVMFETLPGNPNCETFADGSRLARYDFALYVRAHGRDTASRRQACATLMAAANRCESAEPFENATATLTSFPALFNRNLSGNEEYRAEFALFFRQDREEESTPEEAAGGEAEE